MGRISPAGAGGVTVLEGCDRLAEFLRGNARREAVDACVRATGGLDAGRRLRRAMRDHRFETAAGPVALGPLVEALDHPTRDEGFHVLRTWDPARHRFLPDSTPVLLLDYAVLGGARGDRRTLAIFLDAYCVQLLALLVLRAWDAPDPHQVLDRVNALLVALEGDGGSGHRFADGAATLLTLAIAQYHPDERGYGDLLARIRTLDAHWQLAIAAVNASNFAAHLRWGWHAMYGGSLERMRADNAVDYPWVMHAAETLMNAYGRHREALGAPGAGGESHPAAGVDARGPSVTARRLVESLLHALAPDPHAVFGPGPSPGVAAAEAGARARVAEAVAAHREALLQDFEALRPVRGVFSPLSLHFNFLHNVHAAKLVIASREPTPNLPLDELLRAGTRAGPLALSPDVLAHQLAGYARQLREPGRVPLIVHHQGWGGDAWERTMTAVRDAR